jgi:hypothetical protein
MRTIQNFLPNPRHVETNRIFVQALPETAWQTARRFDMSTIPWVRLLFDIRTLFSPKSNKPEDSSLGVDQIARHGKGFMILYENPGKEVIVGAVGQFWHLNIPFAQVKPEDFAAFTQTGWGKLAWAITVEPFMQGSTIAVELRTSATDEDSWQKLQAYYQVIGIGSRLIRQSVMAHLEAELGKLALPDKHKRNLPGDQLIAEAKYTSTHQVRIEAPSSIVWQYLMQLGCDRAGWYSINYLDHGGEPSINHIVDAWKDRQVGDKIAATPTRDNFFEVSMIAHEKYFVMGGESTHVGMMQAYKMSWAFVLEPIGTDATRLLSRARMQASPQWAEWLMGQVVYPPVHSLMSAVQLKTIKRYAERDALMRIPVAVS